MSTKEAKGMEVSSIEELVTAEGLTMAAIHDSANTFLYRDEVSRYMRGLETADGTTLTKHGISEGKIDARILYEALNAVARKLIGKHIKDPENFNWLPGWEEFQAVVERLGQQGKYTHDLAVQLEGLYTRIADTYRGQRNIGRTRTAPLVAGKGHTKQMSELGGVEDVFDSAITDAKDASGITRVKSQVEGPFTDKMGLLYGARGYTGVLEVGKKYLKH